MTKIFTPNITVQKPAPGMRRFFSPANLDRYRMLASGAIGEAEQHQLLEDLAEEMNAFRREARVTAVERSRPFKEDIGFQAGDQM